MTHFALLTTNTNWTACIAIVIFTHRDHILGTVLTLADRQHTARANHHQDWRCNVATNRTMYLYHVTPAFNWFSIGIYGLRSSDVMSNSGDVFLCSKSRIDWAVKHVSKRFDIEPCNLVVVAVRVRRSKLRRVTWRGVRRGVWLHRGGIHPNRIEWIDGQQDIIPAGCAPDQAWSEE